MERRMVMGQTTVLAVANNETIVKLKKVCYNILARFLLYVFLWIGIKSIFSIPTIGFVMIQTEL